MTEEEIINGCRVGDPAARQELYSLLGASMFGVCCRYVRDRQTAEDILHDGFIIVFTKIKDFRGEGSFAGWCRRIFVTTALGHLRRKNPLNDADEMESAPPIAALEAGPLEIISRNELMEAIDKLPEGYRTIINLYGVEGYSHREAAELMGVSEATSRSQYLRAKARLIEILMKKGIISK